MIKHENYGARPEALTCLNEREQLWAVAFDVRETDTAGLFRWWEFRFSHRPTEEEVKAAICAHLKEEEAEVMRKGMTWRGMTVCLDEENQRNYQAQFLANTTAGVPLALSPYYFGEHSEIPYRFRSIDELKSWYQACLAFGAQTKAAYIAKRQEVQTIKISY